MATKKVSGKSKAAKAASKVKSVKSKSVRAQSSAVTAKVVVPKVQASSAYASLRTWNLLLAGLHAVQGIAILLLSITKLIPVTVQYIAHDPLQSAAQGKNVLVAASHQSFEINLAYMAAGFFFVSAIARLLAATKFRKQYEADLSTNVNRVRWIEYALSASLLLLAIGLFVGVRDLAVLLALVGFSIVIHVCTWLAEYSATVNKVKTWLSYGVAIVAGSVVWILLALPLINSAIFGANPTVWQWLVYGVSLAACVGLALILPLRLLQRGRWSRATYTERAFTILNAVFQTAVAWLLFAGALKP